MSCTIRISEEQTSFRDVTVNGKKHTQTIETLTEIVLVPFGIDIANFTDELEKLCDDSYINHTDCGFEGEIVGTTLTGLIEKYGLIQLGEICEDDYYKVLVSW